MIKHIIIIITISILSACAQIPNSELGQYTEAFNQTKQARELVLLDFDQTLKEARKFVEDNEKTESNAGPINFYFDSLDEHIADHNEKTKNNEIVVRQKAFSIIESYNDVLTKLAEGKSIEEVQSATSGLINAASKFAEVALSSAPVPGVAGITKLAQTLVGIFEQARLLKEFKLAVRDGSPVVTKILNILIEDTNAHYNARKALLTMAQTVIVADIVDNVRQLKKLINNHSAPSAPMKTKEVIVQELNDAIQEVAIALEKFGYPYNATEWDSAPATVPPAAAPPAYTALVQVNVDQIITANKVLVKKYKENSNLIKPLVEMLINYRTLLEKTNEGLNTLEAALSKPQNISDTANEILSIAFEIRRNIEDIRRSFNSQS